MPFVVLVIVMTDWGFVKLDWNGCRRIDEKWIENCDVTDGWGDGLYEMGNCYWIW